MMNWKTKLPLFLKFVFQIVYQEEVSVYIQKQMKITFQNSYLLVFYITNSENS